MNFRRNKRELRKNEKGVTLTILVITIIVMLILAGVTISASLNQSGIVSRTVTMTTNEEKILERQANNVNDIARNHASDWGY